MLRPLCGGGDWLFAGDRDRSKPMSNNTILQGLKCMAYKGKMTGHASVASRLPSCMSRDTPVTTSSCSSPTRHETRLVPLITTRFTWSHAPR